MNKISREGNKRRKLNRLLQRKLTVKEKEIKLQEIVISGEKAEMILDFAEKVLYDAENFALSKLSDNKSDLTEVRADYRAALAFYQKINNEISKGKIAKANLDKIRERNEK